MNFLTRFPIHSFRHFLARTYHFATIQNITDDRQTTDRQTTHCAKGTTDSTVDQKTAAAEYRARSTGRPDGGTGQMSDMKLNALSHSQI